MSFLQAVILLLVHSLNGERTTSSIYHLLNGKKSSQTIQDAHLYQLTKWFQTVPFLKRNQFNEQLTYLEQNGWIHSKDQIAYITPEGQRELTDYFGSKPKLSYLKGWQLQDYSMLFWKRINLLMQVASHLIYDETKYYPVTREEAIHRWLKTFLRSYPWSRQKLVKQLYKEVHGLFHNQKAENPLFFILRLSGKNMIGKTASQCADILRVEETEYWFRFLNLLHYMVATVADDSKNYPLLFGVIKDVYDRVTLTHSTKRTAELLDSGHSLETIAAIRKLKENTIEDHIVEITLNHPSFSIDRFVSRKDAEEVIRYAAELPNKKLKPVKDAFSHLTYFQIRLALAKYGDWI